MQLRTGGAIAALAILIALISAPLAHAQFAFDGGVYATARGSDGSLYVGGDFLRQQPLTGGGLILAAGGGGAPDPTSFPHVAGTVESTVSDGDGGWYIGGTFDRVGTVAIRNLAHITRGGALDATWAPNPDGGVQSLAVSGATVYAAGVFKSVGGQPRTTLAAINAAGGVTPWRPSVDGNVMALSISADTVYLVGDFLHVNGQERQYGAAVTAGFGALTAFDPHLDQPPDAVLANGSVIYLGGRFDFVRTEWHPRVAAVDTTGQPLPNWTVDVPDGTGVYALALNGPTLYIGGFFSAIGGKPRERVAALRASDGMVTDWDAGLAVNDRPEVRSLAILGTTLYIGGKRPRANNNGRTLVAVDTSSGAVRAWNPLPGGTVNALAASGNQLFAGGAFAGAGAPVGTVRRLARLKPDGSLDATWTPSPDGAVTELATSGGKLYVSGDFTAIGGAARNRFAELNTATGGATTFAPVAADTNVVALAVSGTTVYASGDFTTFLGQPRKHFAAFDSATGALTPWRPAGDYGSSVLLADAQRVFTLGTFADLGVPDYGLVQFDTDVGAVRAWESGTYYSLAAAGDTVYVGGIDTLRGFDLKTGAVKLADTPVDGLITSLAVSGSRLYVGGGFDSIKGKPRRNLAAIDLATGEVTPWDPRPDAYVGSISLGPTSYVTGQLMAIGRQSTGPLAALDLTPPETSLDGATPLADEPATFECSVAGGAFTACTTVPVGTSVRAVDFSGNADPTPAVRKADEPTIDDPTPPGSSGPAPQVNSSPPAKSGVSTGVTAKSAMISIPFRGGFQLGNIPLSKACRGTLTLELRNGKKLLDKQRVKLSARCRFKATFKAKRAAVGTKKRLSVVVRFGGNRYLGRTTNRFTVRVPS